MMPTSYDLRFPPFWDVSGKSVATRIPMFTGRLGTWHVRVEREPLALEELTDSYDRLARAWPSILRRWGTSLAYACLAERLVTIEPSAFRPGARVLDCGAGTGTLSLAIAQASPVRLRHDLLDLSAPMLQVARRILAARGVKATLVPGDIRRLPYGDDTFDLVAVGHVIEHFSDPVSVLREIRRVTKPGGRILAVVTRRGAIGLLMHLLWRIRLATPEQLVCWLALSGWSKVRFLALEGAWWCNHMSFASLAQKAGKDSPRGEP